MFESYNRHNYDLPEQQKAEICDEIMSDLSEAELSDFIIFQDSSLNDVLELALGMAEKMKITDPKELTFGDSRQIGIAKHNKDVQKLCDLIQLAINLEI